MSQTNNVTSQWRRGPAIVAATLVIGSAIAYASWFLRRADPWWSAMLTNVAVVVFLLAPVEYVLARLRAGFARIEKAADQAGVTAESAKKMAEENARSLEDVRRLLLERQADELNSELDIYRSMTRNNSRDSLVRALRHATESGVITTAGVRSPIWETRLHYRYIIDGKHPLEVCLETDSGKVLSTHCWEDGAPASDFYQTLVEAVRDAGADLGVGLNDPTDSVRDLSEMLIDVTQLRAQELRGYRQGLRLIIERIDGWYFTELYVIPEDDLRYTISIDRLDEMDWEEHLRSKGWWGASAALAFARRLYKLPAPQGE